MSVDETADERETAAATWAIRLKARPEDPDTLSDLQAWLAGDRRRAGALVRARAALSLVDGAQSAMSPVDVRFGPLRRRGLITGGVAAGVAAALTGVAVTVRHGQRYATAVGEMRRVPLKDGSVAMINTDSLIDVEVKPSLRRVQLVRGEAWFEVAKDARRSFVVTAGSLRVRAVGTAFSVRRRDGSADILVTEGVVETWVTGSERARLRLSAGEKASATQGQPPQAQIVTAADLDRTLAWRDGQIALQGETLAYAAAEFNRYNRRKLVIADSSLGDEKLVGQFFTEEPEAFALAVARSLNAKVTREGDIIRLSRTDPGV